MSLSATPGCFSIPNRVSLQSTLFYNVCGTVTQNSVEKGGGNCPFCPPPPPGSASDNGERARDKHIMLALLNRPIGQNAGIIGELSDLSICS